jgi:CHASE3 domain sensor protein
MSRATATPPAGRPLPSATTAPTAGATTSARSGRPAQPGVATSAVGTVVGPTHRVSRQVRTALEGSPGRMRLFGVLAALTAALFGIVGATSLWSSAGALDRADHNTAQVVRIQGIYADLVRADADATNAFLVGGIENPAQRADYDASIARVAAGIVDAAEAQPADRVALGRLNTQLQTYASTVEEARVYNRQGLPIGAQYLTGAGQTLRADVLPVVQALINANTKRAGTEFNAASNLTVPTIVGLLALAVLLMVMVWLARRTHRYLNASIASGALMVVIALALALVTLGSVGNQVTTVRNNDFAQTVALATARSAAFDAKSNESLTLIARGSGGRYETAWKTLSDQVNTALYAGGPQGSALQAQWKAYTDQHVKIRAADDGGSWDDAVKAAVSTDSGSASAAFSAFDASLAKTLSASQTSTEAALLAPVTWVTVLGWLLLLLCLAAALLVLRGIGQRVEEYR